MADVYTDIDNTLDVEANFDNAPQDINAEEQATDSIQVGAQPEQLLSLIGANERLAATNAQLVEQVLPTLRGGLQTKEVAPADIEQVITPDDGYLGLQRVKVAPYEREVQVVNRRANESEYLYYMEDIATQYQRSDYAVAMAGEFYKNVDTTILAGADAYLTSDGDFYTAQTTHTWHDDDDIHANRWVVYYFKEGENKSNFMIADATACPSVLAVKGHLGAIIANIAVPILDIIVPDGSSVLDLRFTNYVVFQDKVIIKNLIEHTAGYLVYSNNCRCRVLLLPSLTTNSSTIIYNNSSLTSLSLPSLTTSTGNLVSSASSLISLSLPSLTTCGAILAGSMYSLRSLSVPNLIQCERLCNIYTNIKSLSVIDFPQLKSFTGGQPFMSQTGDIQLINLPKIEALSGIFMTMDNNKKVGRIYLGCKGTRALYIQTDPNNSSTYSQYVDIEIGDGALQPISLYRFTGLTRENIVNHILVKLGDNTGQSALTLTLGATNLAKLTDEDKAIATAKNWTLA